MNNIKLFVTGTSRSGTNLVAYMLSANKNIHVAPDCLMEILRLQRNLVLNKIDKEKYPFKSTSKLPFEDYYYSDESIKKLDLISNSSANLKLSRDIWKRHFNIIKKRVSIENKDLAKHVNKIYNPNFIKLINNCFKIIRTTRRLKEKEIIGSVDPWVTEMFLPLARSFKNSKFIVIVRDPRASIASHISMKRRHKYRIANLLSYIRCWRKMIALIIYYKSLKIFKNRLHVVMHEELIKNPKRVCKKLCDFLNVKFESTMLNTQNYIDYSTGKIWPGNSNFEKKAFGFSKKRTIRWKKILSYSQIKAIEFIAYHELKLLNYKLYKKNNFFKLKNGLSSLINDDKVKRKWGMNKREAELIYGAEFFRNYLFDIDSVGKDKNLLRRLFLFREVYNKIKRKKSIIKSII